MMDVLRLVCLLLTLQGFIPLSLARRDRCDPGATKQSFDKNSVRSVTVSDSGTPRNLQQRFLSRCNDHEQKCTGGVKKDCDKLWTSFNSSFAYKEPCIPKEAFAGFCDKAAHNTKRDKTLLYSGTYDRSRDLMKLGYITLESTLTGYMLNEIEQWCGQKTPPGINYESCPGRGECKDPPSNAKCAFWQQASIKFAQKARGKVSVLLNGSREGEPVRSDSFLLNYEVPYLEKNAVSEVKILMVYEGSSWTGKCGADSVKNLENVIRGRGIKITCTDYKQDFKTAEYHIFDIRASDEDYDPTSTGVLFGVNIGHNIVCLLFYVIQNRRYNS